MVSYNYQDNHRVIIKKERTCVYGGKTYQLYFQFDITESIQNMHRFFLFFILLYIALIMFVGKFGQHGIEKLLQPLRSMSVTANRLTVNNLHSERLNVAGTKNELRELAGTMNAMLDRLECSYESQKQFVSDASHELRTPIAVIQGYANLLARWGKEDKEILEESIDAIMKEANSMKELVEKHRRIEAPVLEDVMVYGDEQALKQAIRVFIDNAIKYTADGDTIRISCKNQEGTCIIIIEDTGIGMKKEEIKQIFERFYRADSVRNGGVEGHRLGLSIVKLIILKHVGTIRVRSQFEKGSKFTIVLPDYYSQGFLK